MDFVEYADREMLFLSLANKIAGELGQGLRSGEGATLVVPGGTTPGPLFDLLADVELDWARVTVLLSDERWVPESDPRSNAALIRGRLLKGPAAAARFLPFYTQGDAPSDGDLAEICAEISPLSPFTSVVLGMGADMHTASLFPEAEGLDRALAATAPALVALRPPQIDETRVSLSAQILRSAMNIHVLILGSEKRRALERARGLAADVAPINAVLDSAMIHWSE